MGDFNFHVNNQSDSGANKFKALLNQYNLSQHVTIPTHTAGNTLDLVITRSDLLVTGLKSDQSVDSDHFALIFNLSFQSPGAVKRTITYRNWKSVDIPVLRSDIAKAFDGFTTQDPESAVESYNSVLKDIVDKHAPEKSRVIVVRADAPWYTSELVKEKRLRRKLERKYNKTKLAVDKERLDNQRNIYNHLLTQAKQDYFKTKIETAETSKDLYKVCDNLLNREQKSVLPTHDCVKDLADKFITYFNDKISNIRKDLEKAPISTSQTPHDIFIKFDGEVLDSFTEVSDDDIRKIIHSSPTKSCALDPIPTWLLKKCEDELIPVLTLIVNTSLSCAEFPKELKRAFLTPLIKKIILDAEILKNYRPVSNLSFLSKLIERIVCVQLVNHLDKNGLYEVFQSAYRQLHSTETALLRVQNDILQAVDSRGGAILVLLDLSAAFDTIDHETLIRTLDIYCGIRGDPLKWFLSYLKGRVQSVQIGSTFSREQNLLFGVPRGSVLGPVLFTIYTTPLGRIIQRHGLTYHLYADDTQLYMAFKPSDVISKCDAISRIEACVADIRIWMNDNFLKLNDDKTELLIITTREELSKISDISIKVGDQSISPSDDPPRNLGVIFDSTCCLDAHIAKLCRSINFNLYSVGKIRKYLDGPTAEKMINATVTSRLDYCNSLLYGAKQSHIDRLQCCQNNAARIISKRRKFDHISPVLRELHWLPVEHRISYKILLLTYKALNGHAPQYRSASISKYVPPRPLRSEDQYLLSSPRWRLETFGKRAFSKAAPTLWNPLPLSVKQAPSIDSFKTRLKTYLFNKAF